MAKDVALKDDVVKPKKESEVVGVIAEAKQVVWRCIGRLACDLVVLVLCESGVLGGSLLPLGIVSEL